MAEGRPGLARQLRAIGSLPLTAAGVVPLVLVLARGTEVGWGLPGVAGAAPVLAGAALMALGLRLMYETISLFARRGSGTLAPWDSTRKLVVEGPYRRVRNPMISGVFMVLLGEAALLGSPAILAWSLAFAAVNAIYMPLAEEPGLARRFGEDYVTYKRNVPRWIPRRRPWTPLFALALGILLVTAAPAVASEQVAAEQLTQAPAEVRAHWTPERMREAAPIDLPAAPAPGAATASPSPTATSSAQETNPALDTAYPQRLHGILFVSFGAQNGSCSATVVTSRSRNLLLTAGHCVVSPAVEGSSPPIWATNVLFVPGYRNGAAPLGTYAGTTLRAPFAWTIGSGDLSFDVGAVNLAAGPAGQIETVLGSRGASFNRPADRYKKNRTRFQVFGYPAKPLGVYDGERPILCNSTFLGFQLIFSSPVVACNMKEGSSGGGWVLSGGLVNSVVSHNACGVSPTCPTIAGTYFGDTAFKLWSTAGGGIAKGRKKKITACKRKPTGKRANCLMKAQTFRPLVR